MPRKGDFRARQKERRAGKKDCRSRAAVISSNEGVPITHIAAAAGHSSIVITQRYTHPKEADIRSAYERKQRKPIGDAKRREILREVPAAAESPRKSPQSVEPAEKAR